MINPNQKHRRINRGAVLYAAFLLTTLLIGNVQPVLAANMWDKAKEIMQDVYNQIVLISTIAAVVTASVALLLMNFSKSGKTVDESRAWLKRIIITWGTVERLKERGRSFGHFRRDRGVDRRAGNECAGPNYHIRTWCAGLLYGHLPSLFSSGGRYV